MGDVELSFRHLSWKHKYRSGADNLLEDFYIPILSRAQRYDRAVGFFSSDLLISALKGVSEFVKNDGRMRLVVGHALSEQEYLAVLGDHSGDFAKELLDQYWRELLELESHAEGDTPKLGSKVLGYLVTHGHLDLKFALRPRGMYHEKIGVVYDETGNTIVFNGSANETVYGLKPEYNAESITVFKSWEEQAFDSYGSGFVEDFERLWTGSYEDTLTIDVHSELYDELVERSRDVSYENIEDIDRFGERKPTWSPDSQITSFPRIPAKMGGYPFSIRPHQIDAIKSWQASEFTGILKLSTGSGKTITSIYAATRIFEERRGNDRSTALIVAVPYVELAEQWVRELRNFNIHPHKVWGSRKDWEPNLKSALSAHNLSGNTSFIAMLCVNKSLKSEAFQDLLQRLDGGQIVFIGDECHNHGAVSFHTTLPAKARYKLGLSATPFKSDDDEVDVQFPNPAKERILDFYGAVVHEFSLQDAINADILCQYRYEIVPVRLSVQEQELYDAISYEIGLIIASSGGAALSAEQQHRLNLQASKRSRLLGAVEEKLEALDNLLMEIPREKRSKTLIYCGEGRPVDEEGDVMYDQGKTIETVSMLLHKNGWSSTRFTSEENASRRKEIMESFRSGSIDALVSMKVLDEGVDVPQCDTAIITASTRNERQFIQRRGRVLRKAEGKLDATIYDFVILPNECGEARYRAALKEAELQRVDDFCASANNRLFVEEEITRLGLRDE